jgi:hypothetical protein
MASRFALRYSVWAVSSNGGEAGCGVGLSVCCGRSRSLWWRAEQGAAPDRAGILAFKGLLALQPARQVSLDVRRWKQRAVQVLSLAWGCDCSTGFGWHVRYLEDDGAFVAELRVGRPDAWRGSLTSGRLSFTACQELAALIAELPVQVSSGAEPPYGFLMRRPSPDTAGSLLFEYRLGDECRNELAARFAELAKLIGGELWDIRPQDAGPAVARILGGT